MNKPPIIVKLEAELKTLTQEDFLPEEGEDSLFGSIEQGEVVIGQCPPRLLRQRILADKKSKLQGIKEHSIRLLQHFSAREEVAREIAQLESECAILDQEHEILNESFWEQLGKRFHSTGPWDISIRENGAVVRLPPDAETRLLARIIFSLEESAQNLIHKDN
ncbi:MAG: hypothetical protein WC610_02195 [Patescibacteria group bacterium]